MECPIECINKACPDPDFLERNGAWLLSVIGIVLGCFAGLLSYFLKSRCKRINCMGVVCDREVVAMDAASATISTNSKV